MKAKETLTVSEEDTSNTKKDKEEQGKGTTECEGGYADETARLENHEDSGEAKDENEGEEQADGDEKDADRGKQAK